MTRERIKLCALCENKIPDTHVVCRDHYRAYNTHKSEEWFWELVEAQRKQAHIDRKEAITIHKLSENTLSTYLPLMNSRQKSTPKQVIIDMHADGCAPKQIAHELKLPLQTVYTVLRRDRLFRKSK